MARREKSLGPCHDSTMDVEEWLAQALHRAPGASREDLREAVSILEGTVERRRRVFGPAHPLTVWCERELVGVREALARRGSHKV